jgi:hypothetical protein
MFGNDRNQLRQFYCDIWARRQRGESLDPLAAQIAAVIDAHPEYHALLTDPEAALGAEYTPEMGQTNPFLHMGMHLAIREQVSTDRPAGIRAAYQLMLARHGEHEAEHHIMECLGKALWEAQRAGREPDEALYLECVRQLAG